MPLSEDEKVSEPGRYMIARSCDDIVEAMKKEADIDLVTVRGHVLMVLLPLSSLRSSESHRYEYMLPLVRVQKGHPWN